MVSRLWILIVPLMLMGCKTTEVSIVEQSKDFSMSIGKLEVLSETMESSSNTNKILLEESINKTDAMESELDKLEFLFTTYENLTNSMIKEQEVEINNLNQIIREMTEKNKKGEEKQ